MTITTPTRQPEFFKEWLVDEPYDCHDPFEALVDSEVDFDDEWDDDQLPLDEVEAIEARVNLDDPEALTEEP